MRITAAGLVIFGSILTVTVVWAPVGLLMMGFGLMCGLIADRRDARSSDDRPTQFTRSKSWSTPAKTRAPSFGSRDVSSSRRSSADDEGLPVPEHRSPDWPFVLSDKASDLESSAVFSEQAITFSMVPRTANYADFGHGVDQASDDELLPRMISLLAEVVGKGQGSGPEPSDPNWQGHDVDAATREWAETVDEPTYSSGDKSTRSSRDEPVVAHPFSVDLNEVAQMSEAERESTREAEQLMELLNQMSKPNAAGP
jgi:hypothetical protein